MVEVPRWKAVVNYRSNTGIIDVHHDIEEIEDLQDIVERGPDWNTIRDITITLNEGREMTIEQSRNI